MRYRFQIYKVRDLIDWIEKDQIDLKPYYQRNDIWTKADQEALIDTILKGYPLPNFFIYNRAQNRVEMVDGQQRARTIYRFYKEKIKDSKGKLYKEIDIDSFLSYELCFTEVYDVSHAREIEEFYVLVNKKGKHLTTPEIHKAEFATTNFLQLVEELLQYQNFINLNLFTESSSKRMSDRNFVEELIAYLISGIQDKKKIIETIYEKDISEEQCNELRLIFNAVIDKVEFLNNTHQVAGTRYKQRNDFYTLFNFVHLNLGQSVELLSAQYRVLVLVGPYISPSVVDCKPLSEYALNCVSQSNSKRAREERLEFFNQILLNKERDISKNETLAEIADYIDQNEFFKLQFIDISGYFLLDRQ